MKIFMQLSDLRRRILTGPVSDIVNDAVRAALAEDQEDLAAFQERAHESTLSYEELLDDLKPHGQL